MIDYRLTRKHPQNGPGKLGLNGQDMIIVSTYVNRFHRTWAKGYWGMGYLGVIWGHWPQMVKVCKIGHCIHMLWWILWGRGTYVTLTTFGRNDRLGRLSGTYFKHHVILSLPCSSVGHTTNHPMCILQVQAGDRSMCPGARHWHLTSRDRTEIGEKGINLSEDRSRESVLLEQCMLQGILSYW